MYNRVTPHLSEGKRLPICFSVEHGAHTYQVRCTTEATRNEVEQAFMQTLKLMNSEDGSLPAQVRMYLADQLRELIDEFEETYAS